MINVLDWGASGDGKSNVAAGIQAAINACHAAGGGTVYFPPGQYLSGAIVLYSNITLHLETGAVLIGSDKYEDFTAAQSSVAIGISRHALIFACQAENIALTGRGVIRGQGDKYMLAMTPDAEGRIRAKKERPRMVLFEDCKNVTIRDISIHNAPIWTVHLVACDKVNIDHLTILNDTRIPNNDGIDLDRCRNAHISNCHIVAGDDCICLKTSGSEKYRGIPCENITVANCTLQSASAALKIGTETWADIRNCVFSNCTITSSNRGIGVFARDGGQLENIVFQNFIIETRCYPEHWWGKGEPIFMSTHRRQPDRAPGSIRNIRFLNIIARAENAIQLHGTADCPLERIKLADIDLTLHKTTPFAGGYFDVRPCSPTQAAGGIYRHAVPGVYANYVKELELSSVKVRWEGARADYWADQDIILENVKE